MTIRKSALLAAALSVFAVAPATAATTQSTVNFLIGDGGFFGGSGVFAECSAFSNGATSCTASNEATITRSFELFDAALGTLTGVTIQLNSTYPLGTEIFANSPGAVATATGRSNYNIGASTGTLFSGAVDAPTSTCSPTPCSVFTPGGSQDIALNSSVTVASADLANFIGTGNRDLTIVQDVTVNGSATTGGIFARARSNQLFTQGWRGTIVFTYDYVAAVEPEVPGVPEPAALVLLGLGLGALAVRRRGTASR